MTTKPHTHNRQFRWPMSVASAVLFGVVVGLLLSFNVLLVWVATGPRSLERAIPYLENALNAADAPYHVKIGEGLLLWDGWRHPVDIRLKRVDVISKEGVRFATFPEVSLGLNLLALPFGGLEPSRIVVKKPIISLYQEEGGALSFGEQTIGAAEVNAETMAVDAKSLAGVFALFFEKNASPLFSLKRFELEDASVSIGNSEKGVLLKLQPVDAKFIRNRQGITFSLSADIPQGPKATDAARIRTTLNLGEMDEILRGTASLENIWPPMVASLAPQAKALGSLLFPVNLSADIEMHKDGLMESARYALNIGKGKINSEHLEAPIAVEQAQLKGSANQSGEWRLDDVMIDLGAYVIRGNAALMNGPEGLGITANLTTNNVPVDHVRYFWPPSLAPISREWVVGNVSAGLAKEASIVVNIPPGQAAAPVLPPGSINANMRFEGAQVQFLAEHLPLKSLMGTLRVTENTLEGKLERGAYASSSLISNGRVYLADLNADNPLIELKFSANAPARDVVGFLSLPPVDRAAHLSLDQAAVQGTISGDVDLSFYYFTPTGPDGKPRDDLGVTFDIKGKVQNASQKNFLKRFDVEGANGDITANNEAFTFTGRGNVNGANASSARVKYAFTPEGENDTWIDVTARAPVAALSHFGYPAFAFASGTLGVNASVVMGASREHSKATLDLKDAALIWQEMRWKKPLGAPATFSLEAEKKNALTTLSAIEFTAADLAFKGSAQLAAEGEKLARLSLAPFTLRGDSLTLDYAAIEGGHKAKLKGTLDASGYMKGTDDFTFTGLPALEVQLDMERLTLAEGAPLKNLKGSIACSRARCSAVEVNGIAGEKPFAFAITQQAGKRALSASAGDAGAFLHAAGLYEKMKGGELTLQGSFDDAAENAPLSGTLNISQHTIENAPVLARLLSLASLTGFLDTLGGNGISFSKLSAPFTLSGDVITLDEAKTHGPAMGLSVDGTLTFPGEKLDVKGTIVPSYTLNTVLGNVPILGDLITKGGEGVFAANYSMKGPAENPEISVNPLSILTPGFLRGLFDVMDAPADAQKTPTTNH